MIRLSFATWNHSVEDKYIWTRFYVSGWRWTPFVFSSHRYIGSVQITPPREVSHN